MKKKKLSFLADMAVLVLCVCAIAIGVYSAKNASINIGGSVGFNTHDCKVRVLGKISGAYDKDGNKLTENNASATVLFADATDTTKGKLITGTSEENNWKFGNIYYNDLTAPNSYSLAEDIVFTFEITNESAYDVAFKVIKPTSLPDNIVPSITIDNNEQTEETENDATLLNKRGDKVTVVLTLRLGYEENINTANNFNGMQFNFYKPSADDAVTTIDSNFRYQVYPATKTAVVTGLASNATELAIPETITISGDTYAVKKIEASSFNDVNITSVEIPASITSIGDYAFYGCTSLRQIDIPSTVKHIGVEAFTGTPFLGEFEITGDEMMLTSFNADTCPNGIYTCTDTENKKIFLGDLLYTAQDTLPDLENVYLLADNAFYGSDIETINLPETLQYIGDTAFGGCALSEINLPQNLLTIGDNAFGYTSLTNVTIPATVEQIGSNPFVGCFALTGISVNSNNKYYTSIAQKSLIEIGTNTLITGLNNATIPTGITTIADYAFAGVTSIPTTIPDSVTTIGDYAFLIDDDVQPLAEDETTEELLNITLPASLTYLGVGAFANRSNIKSINIPSLITTIYDSTFSNCENLETVTLNDKIERIEDYAFEYTKVSNISMSTTITYIGERAFANTQVANLTLPSTIEFIGKKAFYNTDFLNNNLTDGVYTCADNKQILIKLSNTATTFTPSGYSLIADGAFEGCTKLVSITIPEGITSISGYAGCTSLKSVVLPDSTRIIDTNAFSGCTSLTNINIPNGVKTIGYGAFKGCSSLQKITLPDSLRSISAYVFSDCANLASINIPENTTNIGGSAFSGCTSLTTMKLPEKLFYISSGLFKGCTSLSSVTLPQNVMSIGRNAFDSCVELTSIAIPESVANVGEGAFNNCTGINVVYITNLEKWCNIDFYYSNSNPLYNGKDLYLNEEKIENLVIPLEMTEIKQYVFSGCASLTSVTIGNSVTSIGPYSFYDCTGLTSITIPDSVASIGSSAFSECTSLTNVNISSLGKWCNIDFDGYYSNPLRNKDAGLYLDGNKITELDNNLSGVTEIKQYAFDGYKALTSVTIPDSVISIGSFVFYGCTNITQTTIGNSVTSIGPYSFYGCTGLTSVTIGNNLGKISNSTFCNCTSLISVNIGKSVISIDDSAFSNCKKLESIIMPDSITSIGVSAFSNCVGLTSITIGNSVTSIGQSAFFGCVNTTSVTIPNSVISIGYDAFAGCSGLTSVTIGNSVAKIGSDAFEYCSRLTKVNISGLVEWCNIDFIGVKSNPLHNTNAGLYLDGTKLTILNTNLSGVSEIKAYAFYGYKDLKMATIPDCVTSINYSAFKGCTGLTSVTISDSVTNIGSGAFYECTGLTSMIIPKGVANIGYKAFYGCTGLTSVTISDSVISIGDHAFSDCKNLGKVNITNLTAWEKIKFNYGGNNNPLINNAGLYVNGEAITKLTINDENFNYYAYSGCSTLMSIEYNYNIKKIPQYAFYKCVNIESIKLLDDSTLEVIDDYAFNGCTKLSTINIPSSVIYVGQDTGIPSTNGVYECSDGNKILLKPLSGVPEGVYLVADDVYGTILNGGSPSTIVLPKTLKYLCGGMNSFSSGYYEYWENGGYLTINSDEFYCTYYYDSQNSVQMRGLSYWDIYPYKYVYFKTTCTTLPEVSGRTTSTTEKDGYICYIRSW